MLELYSGDGTQLEAPLAVNDDESQATVNARIVYRAQTLGRYYLLVKDRLGQYLFGENSLRLLPGWTMTKSSLAASWIGSARGRTSRSRSRAATANCSRRDSGRRTEMSRSASSTPSAASRPTRWR